MASVGGGISDMRLSPRASDCSEEKFGSDIVDALRSLVAGSRGGLAPSSWDVTNWTVALRTLCAAICFFTSDLAFSDAFLHRC